MMTFKHLATALSALAVGSSMVILGAAVAQAAGQGEDAETRLSVEYDGTRYFLTRQLKNEELHELLAEKFDLSDQVQLPNWPYVNADVTVWKRCC